MQSEPFSALTLFVRRQKGIRSVETPIPAVPKSIGPIGPPVLLPMIFCDLTIIFRRHDVTQNRLAYLFPHWFTQATHSILWWILVCTQKEKEEITPFADYISALESCPGTQIKSFSSPPVPAQILPQFSLSLKNSHFHSILFGTNVRAHGLFVTDNSLVLEFEIKSIKIKIYSST